MTRVSADETEVRVPVPNPLHTLVRVNAATRRMTMKAAVIAALEAWVSQAPPKAPAKAPRSPSKAPPPTEAPVVADSEHCASCGTELDRGDLMRGDRYYCARCYGANQ